MMDYTKEIERLQKAQSKAAAEQRETADFFADAPPIRHSDDVTDRSDLGDDSGFEAAGSSANAPEEPQALRPEVMATLRKGVSVGLLAIAAILIWYAWSGVDDAWDGYYLQPFQAMFVLVPLIMVMALLALRRMVLQKLQSFQDGSSASIDDVKQRISSTLRWLPKTIMVLVLGSFALTFLLPRGLPLGQWLGLNQPVEADAAVAGVATEAATDAVAIDAVKAGDGSVAANAPKRVGEPTTLLDAVADGNAKAVKKLIAAGGDVNARYPIDHTYGGLTLLHAASNDDTTEIIGSLIKAGAKVNAPSTSYQFKGFTPLHVALLNDRAKVVQLLIDSGARMDAADSQGWQALHFAAHSEATESLPLVILAAKQQKVSIDVAATGRNGETALMEAAEHNFLRGITLLVKAGANLKLRDKKGRTALQYAQESGDEQTIKLLCVLSNKPVVPKATTADSTLSGIGC